MTDQAPENHQAELLWATLSILRTHTQGMRAGEIADKLASDRRFSALLSHIRVDRLKKQLQYASIAPRQVGWLSKHAGLWRLTGAGSRAITDFDSPVALYRQVRQLARTHSEQSSPQAEGLAAGKLAWHGRHDIEELAALAEAYAPLLTPSQEPENFRSFLRRVIRLSDDPGLHANEKNGLADIAWVAATLLNRDGFLAPTTVGTAIKGAWRTLKAIRDAYAFPGERTPYLATWEKALIQYAYDHFRETGKWPEIWSRQVQEYTVEPRAVVAALPREFVLDSAQVVSLTLLGVLRCNGHESDEALAIRVFEYLKREAKRLGTSVTVDTPTLQSELDIGELEARKAIELFNGTTVVSMYEPGARLQVTLEIARFVDLYHLISKSFGGHLGGLLTSTGPPTQSDKSVAPQNKPSTQTPIAAPVDYLFVTALKEELDALLARLPGHRELPMEPNSARRYFYAEIATKEGAPCRAIVAPILSMGRVNAALATARAIDRWIPRAVLLVGIAGGMRGRVKLGDVLVPEQVADYEIQKVLSRSTQIRWQFHRAEPRLYHETKLTDFARAWAAVADFRPQRGTPTIHWGVVATGDKVVDAQRVLKDYARAHSQLDGIEMEAGGVAAAAFTSVPSPGFFMVRGVSDLADGRKNKAATKKWRRYASEVAAECVLELLRRRPLGP